MTPERQPSDRGQLILTTAVIIAISILGMVLVLNSAVLTEQLSAGNPSPESDTGQLMIEGTQRDAGRAVDNVNRDDSITDCTAARAGVVDTVNEYALARLELYSADRGEVVRIDTIQNGDVRCGTYFALDGGKNVDYTDTGGDANWAVAGMERFRGFRLTVYNNSLESSTIDTSNDYPVINNRDQVFSVIAQPADSEVSNGDTTNHLYIFENNGDYVIAIAEGTYDDSLLGRNTNVDETSMRIVHREPLSNDPIEVSLATSRISVPDEGTVKRMNMSFALNVKRPVKVKYRNSDKITGSWELTANNTQNINSEIENSPTDGQPYKIGGAYSVDNVNLSVRSGDFEYNGVFDIAPRQPAQFNRPPSFEPTMNLTADCGLVGISGGCGVKASWNASDPDGLSDLDRVTVRAEGSQNLIEQEIESKTVGVSGQSEGTVTFEFDSLTVDDVDRIVIIIYDDAGNTDIYVENNP